MNKTKRLAIFVWMSVLIAHVAGCGNSVNPETITIAGLASDETLVVIQRESNDCKLSIMATNAKDGSAINTSVVLDSQSEQSLVLSTKRIEPGVDAVKIWAVCKDNEGRIVEMGNTTIAIPLAAQVTRFATKRLPNTDGWYRVRVATGGTGPENISQNDIWSYDVSKAVIVGNAGIIQLWNGFGWIRQEYAPLSCLDFLTVVGTKSNPSGVIVGRSNIQSAAVHPSACNGSSLYSINLVKNHLSVRKNALGSMFNYNLQKTWHDLAIASDGKGKVTEVYTLRSETSADLYDVMRITSDPLDAVLPWQEKFREPNTFLLSYSLSPHVLRKYPTNPYYWSLVTQPSQQYLVLHNMIVVTPPPVIFDTVGTPGPPRSDVLRLQNQNLAVKLVKSFSSINKEAYWLIGSQTASLPTPPISVAIAETQPEMPAPAIEPFTVKQANYVDSSNPGPTALGCTKILVSDDSLETESKAYIACKIEPDRLLVLKCQYNFTSGSNPACTSFPLNTKGSPSDEVLTGIHGSQLDQKDRIWAIGSKGSIWLYQE